MECSIHYARKKRNGIVMNGNRTFGYSVLLILIVIVCCFSPVLGQSAKKNTSGTPKWIYPVIPNIGGVHPRPDLPVRPDPKVDYKIFADIVSKDRDPSGQFQGLERLARLVNLMDYGKVPSNHVHIVALLDGQSGYAAAKNVFYEKQFKADNPNLPIVHALRKAGVKILICSQTLAENGIPDKIVDPVVTITLSALTDVVVYGQKGYIYIQL